MRSQFAIAFGLVFLSIGVWPTTPVLESEWSVSLSASNTNPGAGQSVTLTAITNNDVEGTRWGFFIYDTSAAKNVAACQSGITCTATLTETDSHAYVARVGDAAGTDTEAQSSSVVVAWPQKLDWNLTLSASGNNPEAGQPVTLTAKIVPDVGETQWWLYIYDVTSNKNVATCRSGTSCTASVVETDSHTYVSRIGIFAGTDTQAESTGVNVVWQPPLNWVISLASSSINPLFGENVTLTAQTNNEVGATRWGLYIYDITAEKNVATCQSGTTCTATIAEADSHTYEGRVGNFTGADSQAQSTSVSVEWQPKLTWTVSILASATSPQANQPVTLTARTNHDVGPTKWGLQIYDAANGASVQNCDTGTSCTVQVSAPGGATRTFGARVGKFDGTDTQAQSLAVSANWTAPVLNWSIGLTVTTPSPQTNQQVTLTATTNQDVGPTNWGLQIYDTTTSAAVKNCEAGTTCTISVSAPGGTSRTYGARVGRFNGTDTQVKSSPVTVSWGTSTPAPLSWSVSLAASTTSPQSNQSITLTATANQDVGPSKWGLQIYDTSSGVGVQNCETGSRCTFQVSAAGGTVRSYGARVGRFDGTETQVKSSTVNISWANAPTTADNISLPRPVPSFYQNFQDKNGYWGTKLLGFNTDRRYDIGHFGCTITSLADIFNYYQSGLTDPGKVNDALVALGKNVGFIEGGGYLGNWFNLNKLPATVKPSGVTFRASGSPSDTGTVDQELRAGRPVLAYVTYATAGGQNTHFVVINGKKNGRYTISDPANGRSDQTFQDLGYNIGSFQFFNGPSR